MLCSVYSTAEDRGNLGQSNVNNGLLSLADDRPNNAADRPLPLVVEPVQQATNAKPWQRWRRGDRGIRGGHYGVRAFARSRVPAFLVSGAVRKAARPGLAPSTSAL